MEDIWERMITEKGPVELCASQDQGSTEQSISKKKVTFRPFVLFILTLLLGKTSYINKQNHQSICKGLGLPVTLTGPIYIC